MSAIGAGYSAPNRRIQQAPVTSCTGSSVGSAASLQHARGGCYRHPVSAHLRPGKTTCATRLALENA